MALIFNCVGFAYADSNTPKESKEIKNQQSDKCKDDGIIYTIDSTGGDGGGHMCEYTYQEHYVSASEALGGNIAVDIFYGFVGSVFPPAWLGTIGSAIVGNIATFCPAQGDRVIETMTTSYNYVNKTYTFIYHEYVYRGSTLMYTYTFEDTYYPYENVYSIYHENCPH